MVHRHRLQHGILFRPPRLLPRRKRFLQSAENNAKVRNQRTSLGNVEQQHIKTIRQAGHGADHREGDQPLGGRGDEGV
jgi:hypothetical protein